MSQDVADTAIGRRDASDWDEKKEQAEFFEENFRPDTDTANARLKEIYAMYYQGEFAPNESAISDLFGMIDARDEEVRRLKKSFDSVHFDLLRNAEAENKRLITLLDGLVNKHSWHYEDCEQDEDGEFICDCGYTKLRAEADAALKETR